MVTPPVTYIDNVLPAPIVQQTNVNENQPTNTIGVNPSVTPTNNPPDILNNSLLNPPVIELHIQPAPKQTDSVSINTCYHELQKYSVLTKYCMPTEVSINEDKNTLCKFGRECLMLKSKLQSLGRKVPDTPPTVFTPAIGILKKYRYDVLDCTLMSCFEPNCKQKATKQPKLFHFGCYMHNILTSNDPNLKHIEVHDKDDYFLSLAHQNESSTFPDYSNAFCNNQSLLIPVCGKRCMTNSMARKNARDKGTKTNDTISKGTNVPWDKDGSINIRSSEQVLLDWLTTEENTSSYYGGVGKDGLTSSNRKHTYHLKIANEILKENGSIRTPESVRYKINFFIDSYKEAKERMENTGAGLEGASFEKFQDYVVAKVCKYYLELDPILKNRPNVFPMYTNQHKEEKDKAVAPECIVLEDDPIETRFSNTEFNDTDAFTSSSTSENVLNNNYNSSSDSSTKMSPYKASLVRKSMLRENKKQIHGKTKKLKNTSVTSSDSEERDYMMDCRKKRLELEEKRDLRMGMIEEKKINLEMQRMIMDQTSTELKFESIRLHNMQEKKKLMLINMEVYEKRLKMKRDNPELSEDVLDEMFPMDE